MSFLPQHNVYAFLPPSDARFPRARPAPAPAPAPRRPAPWVILACVPDVSSSDDEIAAGDDLSFDWLDPPRVSLLAVRRSDSVSTVPEDVSPDRDDYPYVVAVDSTGMLLLRAHAEQPCAVPGEDAGPSNQYGANAYILCDACSRKATPLLPEFAERLRCVGNVGLIRGRAPSSDDDEEEDYHMVAELQPIHGTDRAILQRFYTAKPPSAPKEVNYPPRDRPWGSNGVVCHAGKLWWVDLSYGLLSCDPFADDPELHFVALPDGCELPAATATEDLAKRRCVRVSDGKLLYVQIHDGPDGAPTVSMWKLSGAAEELVWELRHEVRFSKIWDNITYRRSPMRGVTSVPVLALVHPKKPDVVCFFQFAPHYQWMFFVHLGTRRVLGYKDYTMPYLERAHHSSRFVHAWVLPPNLYEDPFDCWTFLSKKLLNVCRHFFAIMSILGRLFPCHPRWFGR